MGLNRWRLLTRIRRNLFPMLIGLLVFLAIATRLWAAAQWSANFDSDEAIIGLMARHILRGQVPTYYYGQNYLGSLDALLASVFLRWLGESPFALRIHHILLYGVFMILQAVWVHRAWGWRAALLSVIFVGWPNQHVFFYTYKPNTAASLMFATGTLSLLLVSLNLKGKFSLVRWLVVGILTGLGIWVHPLSVIYLAAWLIPAILFGHEWQKIYKIFSEWLALRSLTRRLWLGSLAVIMMFLLIVGAFFSSGCQPTKIFKIVRISSLVLLGTILGTVSIAILILSERRREVIRECSTFLVGALIGNFPQWQAWLFQGMQPSPIIPSCPNGVPSRLRLLVTDMLPIILGTSPLSWLVQTTSFQSLLQGSVLLIGLLVVVKFIWQHRRILWSLGLLVPDSVVPSFRDRLEVQVMLLFIISVVLVVLGANTVDAWSFRYLLVAWQAQSVMFATILSRGWSRPKMRLVVTLVLILYIWQVGWSGLLILSQRWQRTSDMYSAKTIACLENYMAQHGLRGGYADYWLAYPLDFLTQERLVFSPYNGIVRYPPYAETISRLPVYVYIAWHGVTLPSHIYKQVNQFEAFDRQVCNYWDVWIVRR
jgi:hypothetical protein